MTKILLSIFILLSFSEVIADDFKQTQDWKDQTIRLDLGYPESVEIRLWDRPTISLEANVKMTNTGAVDISDDFQWQIDVSSKRIVIKADFGERVQNTVLIASKTDTASGIPDKATVTASRLIIYVPRGANLDVESTSGTINISHPGQSLLVENIGDITIELKPDQGISATTNTMMGDTFIDKNIKVTNIGKNETGYQIIAKRQNMFHLNGGGPETSIITITGTIRFNQETH